MIPVIGVSNLGKRYGRTVAVEDVSLEVFEGEIFGLIGPNGAGKTTTMECVEGNRVPDKGTISVLGLDPRRDANALRQRIGVQHQEAHLQKRIKVWEAVDLWRSLYPRVVDADALLARLGLEAKRNAWFMTLSGGQKQRLFIALALIHEPEVVFLDELTTEPGQLHGSLHLGVVPILNVALVPQLLGLFVADHPGISLNVEEISSTGIETALEEGRMDVGLGFITRHSPNLRYERLCGDQFALIVSEKHPWWNRRLVPLSELHQQRVLQLPDSFVMRRMSDEICRNHQVRPRIVAEISSIETLLRSLAPLEAAALMPKIALRGAQGLKAIRLEGKNLAVDIGLLRLIGSAANSAVAAFTKLAQATVPKMIRK